MAIKKSTGKSYESSIKASAEWNKANIRYIRAAFNVDTDAEILAKLDSVPNKTDYIRQLILADIAKGNE